MRKTTKPRKCTTCGEPESTQLMMPGGKCDYCDAVEGRLGQYAKRGGFKAQRNLVSIVLGRTQLDRYGKHQRLTDRERLRLHKLASDLVLELERGGA